MRSLLSSLVGGSFRAPNVHRLEDGTPEDPLATLS